jgi:hypothetical protein
MKRNEPETGRYSREVEEILRRRPAFLVRTGIFLLAVIVVILLVISHFIRIPERITASVTFRNDPSFNDTLHMQGLMVLPSATITEIEPGMQVTIFLRSSDNLTFRHLSGNLSSSVPVGGGEYSEVTVTNLSGPVQPGETGTSTILAGHSSLLAKILSPVIAVFRPAGKNTD